jgi:hypothetical protein
MLRRRDKQKGWSAMFLKQRNNRLAALLLATVLIVAAAPPPAFDASRNAVCTKDRAQANLLQVQLSQTKAWDDARFEKGRASLKSLVASRNRLIGLSKRLNGAERSASYASNFGKVGEASSWRRDTANLRQTIELERARAKSWAADAGVNCPGCTYSDLISKVKTALDQAETARAAIRQNHQQLANYQAELNSAGCK